MEGGSGVVTVQPENGGFLSMLKSAHAERCVAIRARLEDFRRTPESGYAYEMFYCLLTPQSSARNAGAVVDLLRERDFATEPFDAVRLLRSGKHYIRFHKTKAARLIEAAKKYHLVRDRLRVGDPAPEVRSWLVRMVDGFGMKEATHFLRNIGRNGGLAILDRHILRNLVRAKVIPDIPASLTERKYMEIERAFMTFSGRVGIPLDELDLLFWSLETGEILK
jgi:N-glycosylase/DNA lyase